MEAHVDTQATPPPPDPLPQVLLVADRSAAVIQPGQPATQMAAWLLDIPTGSTAADTAAEFAGAQGLPIGTVCRVIDLTDPTIMSIYSLDSAWAEVPS